MTAVPQRKRMVRREFPHGVRFLTFSCERRLPLLSNPEIAGLFAARLAEARATFGLLLIAWVVMPEHVHLLVVPSGGVPIDRTLEFIKKSVAQRVIARWRRLRAPVLSRVADHADGKPRFWQKGGGFDRNVRDVEEMTREIRYVHGNPVARGLCGSATDWRFSSAQWWAQYTGDTASPLPVIECDPPPGHGWDQWRGWR